ncbi:DUF1648 domain-containing protein [Microbacterium halophytorum]|uniref:DUF1648 domain-containing protein n=1 Tax=Microbacterium halophytorum TaxID=2067568 RepID=UPI000CFC6255|nr:DUF1648 domain-containing protein [Microbacterium halophytorum]
MTTYEAERRRAVRRFRWVGLYAPLAVFVMLTAAQFAMLPAMPDPAATHWGFTGGPDGFGPQWVLPVTTIAVGGGITLLLALLALSGLRTNSGRAMSYRVIAAAIWFEVGLLGVGQFLTAAMQVGYDDARDVPNAGPALLIGAAIGVVAGFLAWKGALNVPADPDERAAAPEAVDLAPGERAVWIRSVSLSRSALIVLGALVLITLGIALTTAVLDVQLTGSLSAGAWAAIGSGVLATAAVLLAARFVVRVDADGLTVRAPLGWPRKHIAAGDIRSAEVVQVSPMGEFGGWGWRYGVAGAGMGIVMRAGEGIRVTTNAGKLVTVTVDDAETAVALLRGLTSAANPREDGGRDER